MQQTDKQLASKPAEADLSPGLGMMSARFAPGGGYFVVMGCSGRVASSFMCSASPFLKRLTTLARLGAAAAAVAGERAALSWGQRRWARRRVIFECRERVVLYCIVLLRDVVVSLAPCCIRVFYRQN